MPRAAPLPLLWLVFGIRFAGGGTGSTEFKAGSAVRQSITASTRNIGGLRICYGLEFRLGRRPDDASALLARWWACLGLGAIGMALVPPAVPLSSAGSRVTMQASVDGRIGSPGDRPGDRDGTKPRHPRAHLATGCNAEVPAATARPAPVLRRVGALPRHGCGTTAECMKRPWSGTGRIGAAQSRPAMVSINDHAPALRSMRAGCARPGCFQQRTAAMWNGPCRPYGAGGA